MNSNIILGTKRLGFQWETVDPFLFCAHHDDNYPAGNESMGPAASLGGRNLGQDFEGRDGWRMYHGDTVPGFPYHPHRGFETVTIVRRGLVDHADSLGAAARFGDGDVQWLTAGSGILHSEMFPLVDRNGANPLELFQIWLNLPRAGKMVEPYFTMFWSNTIPKHIERDGDRVLVEVTVIAGRLGDVPPLKAPPGSWASQAESDVAIWTIRLAPGARWTLPPANEGTNRTLYFFAGKSMNIAGEEVDAGNGVMLRPDVEVALQNGDEVSELLLLQGRPIGEPVAQHGPFVMNTREEVQQAFADYKSTQFGGWPWPSSAPVHPREEGRFARHADGLVENAS